MNLFYNVTIEICGACTRTFRGSKGNIVASKNEINECNGTVMKAKSEVFTMGKKNIGLLSGGIFCWMVLFLTYFFTTGKPANIILTIAAYILISYITSLIVFCWGIIDLSEFIIVLFICQIVLAVILEGGNLSKYLSGQTIAANLNTDVKNPLQYLYGSWGWRGATVYLGFLLAFFGIMLRWLYPKYKKNHLHYRVYTAMFLLLLIRAVAAVLYSFDISPIQVTLPFSGNWTLYLDTLALAFLARSMVENALIDRFVMYHFVSAEKELGCTLDEIRIVGKNSDELYNRDTASEYCYCATILYPDKEEQVLGTWWSPEDDGNAFPDWYVVTFELWETGKVIVLRFDPMTDEWSFVSDQRVLKSVCRRFLKDNKPECLTDGAILEMC